MKPVVSSNSNLATYIVQVVQPDLEDILVEEPVITGVKRKLEEETIDCDEGSSADGGAPSSKRFRRDDSDVVLQRTRVFNDDDADVIMLD